MEISGMQSGAMTQDIRHATATQNTAATASQSAQEEARESPAEKAVEAAAVGKGGNINKLV
jgi:hypothetical protein